MKIAKTHFDKNFLAQSFCSEEIYYFYIAKNF